MQICRFANQCRQLAVLHGIDCSFALLTREDPGGCKHHNFTVCSDKGVPRLQQLHFQALVKDIPELPQNPVTQSTQKPTELQLHVFRITVPSIFLDNARWLHICTSPQKALHALIDPLELHSSYGWKKTTVGTAEKQERGLFVKAPPCVQNGRRLLLGSPTYWDY